MTVKLMQAVWVNNQWSQLTSSSASLPVCQPRVLGFSIWLTLFILYKED